MVVHKVAPALASGNTVIVKPPQPTPFSATILFEILLAAGIPPNHIQLVQGDGAEVGATRCKIRRSPSIPSPAALKSAGSCGKALGLRPSALELGQYCGYHRHEDADLERAAPRIANQASAAPAKPALPRSDCSCTSGSSTVQQVQRPPQKLPSETRTIQRQSSGL